MSITINGASNDLTELQYLPLLAATAKRRLVVSFQRRSLIYLLLILCGDIERCPGPNSSYAMQEIKAICNEKGLKFFHQNVCGLQGKHDEIREILIQNKKIDIFSLTELFMADTAAVDCNIQGYGFVKRGRTNGNGGCVGAYIWNGMIFNIRQDLDDTDIEGIWIENFPKSSKSFIFGIIYKPPDSSNHLSKHFTTKLLETIEKINRENKRRLSWET